MNAIQIHAANGAVIRAETFYGQDWRRYAEDLLRTYRGAYAWITTPYTGIRINPKGRSR